MLCLLAVRGEARRDEIVDLLWREADEARGRNAFRQALHRLRAALGPDALPQDRERLRLVRSAGLVIDLDSFEAAATAGRLDAALSLYAGDFLEGATLAEPPFDIWVEQQRTRLRARIRELLEASVSNDARAGRWTEAIGAARRLLLVAPFDAPAAHLAATTLVSAGRRGEALELVRQFGTRLGAELGLPMPSELQSLLSRLERQQNAATTNLAAASLPSAPPSLAFVGREKELSQVLTLIRTAGQDAGGLVLIEAGGGGGKSRLVSEIASHAKSLGPITVLTAREHASGAHIPLGLFATALRPLVRASGVLGASRHLLAEAARLLPELRDEFDLPAVQDVDDDAARLRFFEGVAALVDAAAFERPILLVLEDLHYIAPSSLDLLSYLCVRLAGTAITFVLTARPDEAAPAQLARLRALARSEEDQPPHGPRAQWHQLSPLTTTQAESAVRGAGIHLELTESVLDRIVRRAEGNPGLLTEFVRRAAIGEDIAALPVALRGVVAERLDRLTSSQRRLLLALALIDRPVTIRLAAAAAHLSEPAATELMAVLENEALVERMSDERFSATTVAAECATSGASSESRTFLSGWIADALTREVGTSAADLARFYAAAGQPAPTFEHARRAAFDSLAVGAAPEAIYYLGLARTFASSGEQRAEIERMLEALGSGRRRLGAVTSRDVSGPADEPVATPSASADGGSLAGWQRHFPNWRVLFGAAVATLVVSAAVLATLPPASAASPRAPSADTLVVADGATRRALRYVTGDLATGFSVSGRIAAPSSNPRWLDSLSRPWANPIAAPDGSGVALARITSSGSDVYVVSADRRDTLAIAVGRGDAVPLDWSPDGRWLLGMTSRVLPDGTYDTDLWAYSLLSPQDTRPIDSTARRAITEAVWSPDGSRIAWVARAGTARQMDIFASLSDGSEVHNVSRHPADDYHISWSSDGELLAFTSMRDGNAELYAANFAQTPPVLWRLTNDPSQDDHGVFSVNGRLMAFESTRGGTEGIYVMPSLGGDPHQLEEGLSLSVDHWRGGSSRYVDRVRVRHDGAFLPGDTSLVRLSAFDQFSEPLVTHGVRWRVLDSTIAYSAGSLLDPDGNGHSLVGRRPGLARVIGSVGLWRADTAFVRVGGDPVTLLSPAGIARLEWRALGTPVPTLPRTPGTPIILNADREWDSGILSRAGLPLLPGLVFATRLAITEAAVRDAATTVNVALVAPEDESAIDSVAPQFLRYGSFMWNAEPSRFVYAVGREVFAENAGQFAGPPGIEVRLVVEPDSTMSFWIDGRRRWRSTLRVIDARRDARVHAWIAGRATGTRVSLSRSSATLMAADAPSDR